MEWSDTFAYIRMLRQCNLETYNSAAPILLNAKATLMYFDIASANGDTGSW